MRPTQHPVDAALFRVVIASSVFAVGCAKTDQNYEPILFDPCSEWVIDVSDSSTVDERQAVIEAVDEWNQAAQLSLQVLSSEDDGSSSRAPRLIVEFEEAAPMFFGVYEDHAAMIFVNRSLEGRSRIVTIAHELGHAVGLVHVDRSDSVMRAGNLSIGVGERDASALRSLWGVCQ